MENEQKNPEKSGNVLEFIFRHLAGQGRWLVLAAVATVGSVVASFLMPQVIRYAVDAVIGGGAVTMPAFLRRLLEALAGGGAPARQLVWLAVWVVVIALLSGLFNFVARMGMATGTERFCRNLREGLFAHVQSLPFKWHVENKTGDIIQRCTSDLEVVRNFLATQLLEVVRTVILVAVALVLMFSMNVTLALVSLAFIPLIGLYSIIFYRLIGKRFLTADEAEGELTVDVQENLTGVRVVRAFGREKYELERFDGYNNRWAELWIKLGHTLSIFWGTSDLATGAQILTVVVVGTVLAANGQITMGEFLAFAWYNNTLAWPVRALGRTLSEMSKTGVSAGRIQEILDAEPEPEEPGALTPDLHADIRFENVTFRYEQQPVLQDLSFTIPKGSTFGIMGATGSGKSTITYLLNRLYDLPPGLGNIWYGEVEIRNIDRKYLRRNVGLVLQEPFLFSKTIEENIAITGPEGPSLALPQAKQASPMPATSERSEERSGMQRDRHTEVSQSERSEAASAGGAKRRAAGGPTDERWLSEQSEATSAEIERSGMQRDTHTEGWPPAEAGKGAARAPDRARVRRAAGMAAVDEAISAFSGGYETVVGERGVTLSGGQKQRVAIARTLMLGAPVMVFDDSMSAVDLETDAKIRAALRRESGDATVILISHRINTLMAADCILVLEDGRVADMGTHAELISRPGMYKRIYDMQSEAAADVGARLEDLGRVPEGGSAGV